MFDIIESPEMPLSRWATSLVVHGGAVVLLVAIPWGVTQTLEVRRMDSGVRLVAPRLTPPPVQRVVVHAPPPVVQRVKFQAPLLETPQIKTPVIEVAKIEAPKIEPAKIEPAKIAVVALASPKPDLPAPPAITRSNVKVGGFGDPNGVRPSETSTGKGLLMAHTGSFDLPAGAGEGRGGGNARVVMAGFGDGVGTGTGQSSGHPGGQVQNAGFGDYRTPAAPVRAIAVAAPVSTPVEILSKPKPVYTAEARERHVEGEVQLDVFFRASGQVEVLSVIHGLGLGLDEAAAAAASHIRFRPGTRDGSPVDMRGIVHIVFQLS